MASSIPPFLALSIFTAMLGMFQFGFNTGVVNAPQAQIEDFIAKVYKSRNNEDIDKKLTSTIFSLVVCAFLVGGMIGGLSGGLVAEKFGRKNGLLYTQSLSLIGAILSGCSRPAQAYEMLIIGRLMIGVACGLFTGLVPLYITEVAPVNIRGGMGTLNQLAVTTGIFLGMILGLSNVLGSDTNWPILVSLTAIPSVLQTILLFAIPESPRYLILSKKDEEAGRKILVKLRNTEDVDDELEEIKSEAVPNSEDSGSLSVWQLIRSKHLRLALFVTICMHLSQQLSGITAIFYYSTKFFTSAGISCDNSQFATLGVGAIMVTMTVVTIPFVDKLGRRTLHFIGVIGMIVSSILITIALNLSDLESVDCSGNASPQNSMNGSSSTANCNNTAAFINDPSFEKVCKGEEIPSNGAGIFAIIGTLTFVVFFALGPGSIPWLITGELFTQAPRSAAIAIATFVNWTGNLIVGLVFPQMQERITNFSFLPFTVALVLLFVALFYYLPETKGIPVSEIEALFQIPNAWKRPIGPSNKILLVQLKEKQDSGRVNYGATEAATGTKS